MCQQYKTEASMIKHNILFIGLDTHKSFTQEQSGMVGLCLLQAQTCRYLLKSLCLFRGKSNQQKIISLIGNIALRMTSRLCIHST